MNPHLERPTARDWTTEPDGPGSGDDRYGVSERYDVADLGRHADNPYEP